MRRGTTMCLSVTRNILLRCSTRFFGSSESKLSAYDSDGKTTATILNQESGSNLMIDSYSVTGFRLNNGLQVVGPTAVFPKSILGWNISDENDISQQSLSLFTLLEPKLDILVIGYGNKNFKRSELDLLLLKVRKRYSINIELLPTDRAIATYNFLVSESRWVAAALIPPTDVKISDDDMAIVRKRRLDSTPPEDNQGYRPM